MRLVTAAQCIAIISGEAQTEESGIDGVIAEVEHRLCGNHAAE